MDKLTAVLALYLVTLILVPCLAMAVCGRTTQPMDCQNCHQK